MSRRNRSDGLTRETEIFQGAGQTIEPPEWIQLTEQERQVWDCYIKSKAYRAWDNSDLDLLADAARLAIDIPKYVERARGYSSSTDRSVKLERLIDMLVKRQRLLFIYLQIHPAARNGKAGTQQAQNGAHTEAMEALANMPDDPLLARPSITSGFNG